MKIAFLVPGGVDRSGTHRVIPCLLWLVERLTAAGDEVHVFAFRQEPAPSTWDLLGAKVHNAGQRWGGIPFLRAFLAEHRRARFDVLHAFWAVPAGAWAAMLGRLFRIPVLLSLLGGDTADCPSIGYGGQLRSRSRRLIRFAMLGADRVIAPSNYIVGQAGRLGIDVTRVPLGVALDRWPKRPPRRRKSGEARLLQVASLNRVKDQTTLLHAAARLVGRGLAFRLDVIGEDTLDGEMQRLARKLELHDVVHFHGFLPHSELRAWVEGADLLVLSSLHEGAPIAMLEAAVAGVPTVGTSVGHIVEWAPEAAIGVPVGDAEALAEGVAALLTDEDRRMAMASRAQQLALSEDADFTARATRRLYAEIVDK